jgi:hypothetical protein
MKVRPDRLLATLSAGLALLAASPGLSAAPSPDDRIELRLDASEADAVLSILEKARAGQAIAGADWESLFSTRPYVRLRQREEQMHRSFTDESFKQFVLSPGLAPRADSLRRTLDAWKQADLMSSARRVLAYLPDSARIRASVYPVIKPKTNSFVFEPSTDAAIFLYLDPAESAAQFENTVAHESHHIGFSSVSKGREERLAGLSPRVETAVGWMGAFGEGFAMLAAAGGPGTHPQAASPPADRVRWDLDMTHFDRDRLALETFFLEILDGRLVSDDEIATAGFTFFGVQGPWYTVGYRMAALVEKHDGRAVLIDCMLDPRQLLVRYNAAAQEENEGGRPRLPLWSPELLKQLGL